METADTRELDCADMCSLADGEDAVLNRLMSRHAEKLFHYLIRLLRNTSEAEDLTQEAFVRVYQHRASFKADGKFTTWLYTIATNLARNRARWFARHPQVTLDGEADESGQTLANLLPDPCHDPSGAMQCEESAAQVRAAVAALPEKLRLPLLLFEYERHSLAEIGVILGCSTKAAESRLHRARDILRERLQEGVFTT